MSGIRVEARGPWQDAPTGRVASTEKAWLGLYGAMAAYRDGGNLPFSCIAPAGSDWREIVPPRADAVLESARVAGDKLALSYLERASSRLRLADLDGGLRHEVELPTLGSLFGLGAEWDGPELFYGFSSYTVPPSVYRIDLKTGEQTLWRRVEAEVDPIRLRYATKLGQRAELKV